MGFFVYLIGIAAISAIIKYCMSIEKAFFDVDDYDDPEDCYYAADVWTRSTQPVDWDMTGVTASLGRFLDILYDALDAYNPAIAELIAENMSYITIPGTQGWSIKLISDEALNDFRAGTLCATYIKPFERNRAGSLKGYQCYRWKANDTSWQIPGTDSLSYRDGLNIKLGSEFDPPRYLTVLDVVSGIHSTTWFILFVKLFITLRLHNVVVALFRILTMKDLTIPDIPDVQVTINVEDLVETLEGEAEVVDKIYSELTGTEGDSQNVQEKLTTILKRVKGVYY